MSLARSRHSKTPHFHMTLSLKELVLHHHSRPVHLEDHRNDQSPVLHHLPHPPNHCILLKCLELSTKIPADLVMMTHAYSLSYK